MSEVYWAYEGKIDRAVTLPAEIGDLWLSCAKAAREFFRNKVLARIPDEASYLSRLALPSGEGYASFVNDAFPNSRKIETRQLARVSRGYSDWDAGFKEATKDEESPGAWLLNLEAGRGKYGETKYALMGVGDSRHLGYKPVWKAVMALCGSKEPLRWKEPGWDFWTNEENLASPFKLPYRRWGRCGLVPILVQGLVLAIYCEEVRERGISEAAGWRDATISKTNSRAETMTEPMLRKVDGKIEVGGVLASEAKLYLEYREGDFFVGAKVLLD